jgi:NADH:ubiquinone oxidoreductase subunit H
MEYRDYDMLFSFRISAEINRQPMDLIKGGESELLSGFKIEYFLVEFSFNLYRRMG